MTYSLGSSDSPDDNWGNYWNKLGIIISEEVDLIKRFDIAEEIDSPPSVFDEGGYILRVTLTIEKIFTNVGDRATCVQILINSFKVDQSSFNGFPIDYNSDELGSLRVKVEKPAAKIEVKDVGLRFRYKLVLIESTEWG